MHVLDSLVRIRPACLETVSRQMAHGEGVRESFLQQLNVFYDAIMLAIETGKLDCLDGLLGQWVEARTQSELESAETSLSPFLNQILVTMLEIAQQNLPEAEVVDLAMTILPAYAHAIDYAARLETERRVLHISTELEKTKNVLERLDKSKSDFISVAAHELKTPLTLIEGYTAMLRDALQEKNGSSPVGLLLTGIDHGTRRLRTIVDDMIDVSMIDNNLLSLNFQPVRLNRLLGVVARDFSETVKARKLALDLKNFPGSEDLTFADEERLYQAFRNVVSNAIKYTPDGGRITIDGRRLPGFVEVTVADSGIGIDPEDHLRIFEKFGRLGSVSLHSSGKTKFKGGGPGLGLAITKGIIEAHGGAIWVESEGYSEVHCPGATFHILLPLRKEPSDDRIAKLFRPMMESDDPQKDLNG